MYGENRTWGSKIAVCGCDGGVRKRFCGALDVCIGRHRGEKLVIVSVRYRNRRDRQTDRQTFELQLLYRCLAKIEFENSD